MHKKLIIFAIALFMIFLTQTNSFAQLTPGFWKQTQHFKSWNGYFPSDPYNSVFGVTSSFASQEETSISGEMSLLDVLNMQGGGEEALGRHAVAALLNSVSEEYDYYYTEEEVKVMVRESYSNNYFIKSSQLEIASEYEHFEAIKDYFEVENELGVEDDD